MCFGIMTVLCGVLYTVAVTSVSGLLFPKQAGGSIITVTNEEGETIHYGSALIGQEFTKPGYLIGRPMKTTNLSPVSKEQKELVEKRIQWWHTFDTENLQEIPIELVTASGSGVDPNISSAGALYQVARIAKVRGISEAQVKEIIEENTTRSFLGLFGEPAVNVLKVNMDLDGLE